MTTPQPKPKPQRFVGLTGFAQRVGLAPGTISSYGRKGLLPPPDRHHRRGRGRPTDPRLDTRRHRLPGPPTASDRAQN